MADIDPALVEDRAVLGFKHIVGNEHLPVDREGEIFVVLNDEAAVAVGMAVTVLRRGHFQAPETLDFELSLYLARPAVHRHLMLQHDLAALTRRAQDGERNLDRRLAPAAIV